MIILLDLDNTLRDIWVEFRRYAWIILGRDGVWPEDWTIDGPSDYWFLEAIPDHPRVSQLYQIWLRKGFFEHAPAYYNVRKAVYTLEQHGTVFFVTSPLGVSDYCHSENKQWVHDTFGPDWVNRLVQSYDKTLIYGDVLVDDKPDIEGVKEPAWTQVLFDQPYNQHVDHLPRIYDWYSPEEILQWAKK